jgi:hypothetical protein
MTILLLFQIYYESHPDEAVEEMIAVTDPSLSLLESESTSEEEDDQRPQYRMTCFALYDENGHMISIDDSMMERQELGA